MPRCPLPGARRKRDVGRGHHYPGLSLRGAEAPISGATVALVDMTADGQRFLFAMPLGGGAQDEPTVVLNWPSALQK
jgi:hypothetical protein